MKQIFFFVLIISSTLFSQNNDNCVSAMPLFSNPSFTFFTNSGPGSIVDFSVPASSNISNPTPNPNPPNSGCLFSGELNPQWLIVHVSNAGSLEFIFGANGSANPQVGLYDWIMWPYSPTTCAGIFNNTLPPVRCNWNGSGTGGTGIASASYIAAISGSSANFEAPLTVNACDQFIICISNFSGVNTLVTFESIGTASLFTGPSSTLITLHSCASTATLTSPLTFSNSLWQGPSGFISNASTITTTMAGSYSVSTGGTNSCASQMQVTNLTISEQTLQIISSNSIICSGQSIVLSTTSPANYTWSTGSSISSILVNPTTTATYSVFGMDSLNCLLTDTFTVFVSDCVGLEEVDTSIVKMKLFPNPNKGEFNLLVDKKVKTATLVISNSNGQVVFKRELVEGLNGFKLNQLPIGIYYYTVLEKGKQLEKGKLQIN